MKDLLSGLFLGLLLGFAMATQYWLKVIPLDYVDLYEQQSEVIDKCTGYLHTANASLNEAVLILSDELEEPNVAE